MYPENQTAAARRHFLCPKNKAHRARLPLLPADVSAQLTRVGSAERKALEQIAETADLLDVPGAEQPYLLIPASPALLDVLAAFDAEQSDLEPETDAGPDDEDDGDDDKANDSGNIDIVSDGWASFPLDGDYVPEEGTPPPGAKKSRERHRARLRRFRRGGHRRWVDPLIPEGFEAPHDNGAALAARARRIYWGKRQPG